MLNRPAKSESNFDDLRLRTIEALLAGSHATRSVRFPNTLQRTDYANQVAESRANSARQANAQASDDSLRQLAATDIVATPMQPIGRFAVGFILCILILTTFFAGVFIGALSGSWRKEGQLPVATAIVSPRAKGELGSDTTSHKSVSETASRASKTHSLRPRSALRGTDAEAWGKPNEQEARNRRDDKSTAPLVTAPNKSEPPKRARAKGVGDRMLSEGERAAQKFTDLKASATGVRVGGLSAGTSAQTIAEESHTLSKVVSNPNRAIAVVVGVSRPLKKPKEASTAATATATTAKYTQPKNAEPTVSASAPHALVAPQKVLQIPPHNASPVQPPITTASRQEMGFTSPPMTAEERQAFIARGDALLITGDITAARLFYRYGAEAGDGVAALRLGESFDPLFIAQAHLGNVRGDARKAAYWYHWASDLSNSDANILLKSLKAAGK